MTSETEISAAIRGALVANGFWIIRLNTSGRRGRRSIASGEKGMPDLMLPEYGWLEVKTDKGKLSDEQEAWHAKAIKRGVRVATVRSVHEALRVALLWKAQDES